MKKEKINNIIDSIMEELDIDTDGKNVDQMETETERKVVRDNNVNIRNLYGNKENIHRI